MRHFGPRSDEAHLPHQDVPYLRQLIELQRAQDPPNPSHPTRVSGVETADILRRSAHRPEFADPEPPEISTDALLQEEDRASTLEFDDDGDQNEKRRHYQQAYHRQRQVK